MTFFLYFSNIFFFQFAPLPTTATLRRTPGNGEVVAESMFSNPTITTTTTAFDAKHSVLLLGLLKKAYTAVFSSFLNPLLLQLQLQLEPSMQRMLLVLAALVLPWVRNDEEGEYEYEYNKIDIPHERMTIQMKMKKFGNGRI